MATHARSKLSDPKDFMKTFIDEINDNEATGLDIEIQIRN